MLNNVLQIPFDQQLWYIALFAWAVVWQGLAMYRAAQRGQQYWFWVFLLVHTLGILEILYIYVFSVDRKAKVEEK